MTHKSDAFKVTSKPRRIGVSELSEQLGKLPPQAVELEETILGAIMLERKAISRTADIITEDSFYKEAHQHIYLAVIDLFKESKPIDIKTVTHQLRKNGHLEVVGGAYYVSQLTAKVNSAANIETHARIVQEYFMKRELIRIGHELQDRAYEDTEDIHVLFDYFSAQMTMTTRGLYSKQYEPVANFVVQVIEDAEAANKSDTGVTGVPTGFRDFDKHTAGFQDSDLIIIAARPGMGKTGWLISASMYAAAVKFPVAIFSLEMASKKLTKRMISIEAQIDTEKFTSGRIAEWEWEKLMQHGQTISNLPIYIDDTPSISLLELRTKSRRLVEEHGVKIIYVDYLQLMSGSNDRNQKYGNREQEIAEISRGLKGLAKELEVPVVALSQLSRAVETRGGEKRPQLSDLRESGAIEQDADMVCFLYRPEYYGITEDDKGMPLKGIAETIISKYRDGKTGDIQMRFIGRFTQWTNLDHVPSSQSSLGFEDDKPDFTITIPSKSEKEKLNDEDDQPF